MDQKDYQLMFDFTAHQLTEPILAYRCDVPEQVDWVVAQEIPLPFPDFHFNFALSTYPVLSSNQSLDQIIAELKELARVAKEIRLAPIDLKEAQVEKTLGPLMLALQQAQYGVEIRMLNAREAMLRIWALLCVVT
jgi:ubiquinone/menaquinone biosynthesis C-methylase UbiE